MGSATKPLRDVRDLQRAILERIARGHPLGETLDDLCLLVGAMVPDSICSVMLLDADNGTLSFGAAPCLPAEHWIDFGGLVPGTMAGSCGSAVFTHEPAIVGDTSTDPRWEGLRSLADSFGLKACWSIPLLREGRAMGSFAISRTVKGGPTDEQMELLGTAANLASLALGRDQDERSLAEHRELLASLLESVVDPIFAKDEQGRYLLANDAGVEAMGVTETFAEMAGKTDEQLCEPEVAARRRAQDLAVIRDGETIDYRQSTDSPALGRRTFLVRKSPLRDGKGKIRGVVGVARDVTQIEQAELALRQAQRAESLGILAGGVAHDFNNLLTGVLGNCSLALAQTPPGSPLRPLLDEIEHAAVRAAELTDQMLAYAGRAETHTGPVALAPLVREVLALVGSGLDRQTCIDFQADDDDVVIRADATQIRQVALNLVTNGSQALEGRAGRVRLALTSTPEQVRLTVRDEGSGMDDATRERIFEPFFTTKAHGRGLGLAASAGIVQAHGGSLECESAPGAGTTFTLRLPRCETTCERCDLRDGCDAPASPTGGGGTVLIADDQAAVRKLARHMLEPNGHRVIEAGDGIEALALAREHASELDLLLLDVRMPGLNGDEVLARLRAEGVDCPALLSSGHGPEGLTTLVPGDVGFLKKPYRPSELLSAVLRARGV
jgi:two-component system, cell cycle sensor histidine kinase and response regulator CckA